LIETLDYEGENLTNRYAPEIVIVAPDRGRAQRALNLIGAGSTLLFAQPSFEDMPVIPCSQSHREGMRDHEIEMALGSSSGTPGYWKATAIAARSSQRTKWTFALAKYLASVKCVSVHPMDHHPRVGSRFSVDKDPIEIVKMAQAIALAYSVIEELGLEVRANAKTPSKIEGKWNPPVLECLTKRLREAGLNEDEKFDWMVRGSPKLIEKKQKPPDGSKTPWTQRRVRDRHASLVDAIGYASFLRSRVAAHATGTFTKHLTMVDVSNVQDLARQLTLRSLGVSKGDAPLVVRLEHH
jgi:hypothetical protein